jgi:serine/threonine protein phosphatase PrpC
MVTFIERTAQWKSYLRDGASNVKLLGDALIQAFEDIDAAIRIQQETGLSVQDTSGCTANTAMITPTHIVCANAGDSRCVLGTNRMSKGVSNDFIDTTNYYYIQPNL